MYGLIPLALRMFNVVSQPKNVNSNAFSVGKVGEALARGGDEYIYYTLY